VSDAAGRPAYSNLHVMRFLGLLLEDDVPDRSVLSRFRTLRKGGHVGASITQSPRKLKTRPAYEVVNDREERDGEADAQSAMRVIEVTQPGVNSEARWVRKSSQSVFGYKQHTVVDDDGLVMAVVTTAANCHDSKPLLNLLDKVDIQAGTRIHADKAYCSQKHRDALKALGLKNGEIFAKLPISAADS